MGNKATRVIPKELGTFKSSVEAWERRVQSGQAMVNMAAALGRQDVKVSLANFANWTDRIAAGELPFAKPERPQGVERNIVVTQWDWADPKVYLHDQVSTDKRKPTVNAYGKNYGATEESADYFPILDSQTNRATMVKMPVRDADMESTKSNTMAPSVYWGDEAIWDCKTSMHNPMMDERGDVWFTSRVGKPGQPGLLPAGLGSSFGEGVPAQGIHPAPRLLQSEDRRDQADPDLLQHPPPGVRGRRQQHPVDQRRRCARRRHRLAEPQGVRGNRRRAEGPGLDPDRHRHQRQRQARRLCRAEPAGRSHQGQAHQCRLLWGRREPGRRYDLGFGARISRVTSSASIRVPIRRRPPWRKSTSRRSPGFGPRGFDIDRNGVAYVPLSSGHLAAFDRRKCKGPLNGPQAADGKLCPEGWTLTPFPGPQFRNVAESGSAEASYYTWVDQFNTSGLGTNVPMATGNANELLLALVDGKWVNMRVPYPLGFFAKWMDGRIDDPECRLEGPGRLDDLRQPNAVPHGNRQGNPAQGGQVPGPSGPAGTVRQRSGLRPALLPGTPGLLAGRSFLRLNPNADLLMVTWAARPEDIIPDMRKRPLPNAR